MRFLFDSNDKLIYNSYFETKQHFWHSLLSKNEFSLSLANKARNAYFYFWTCLIFEEFLQRSNQWPLSGDLKIFLFYKKSIKSNGQEQSTFLALKVWKRDEYWTYGTEKAQRPKKITKKRNLRHHMSKL